MLTETAWISETPTAAALEKSILELRLRFRVLINHLESGSQAQIMKEEGTKGATWPILGGCHAKGFVPFKCHDESNRAQGRAVPPETRDSKVDPTTIFILG